MWKWLKQRFGPQPVATPTETASRTTVPDTSAAGPVSEPDPLASLLPFVIRPLDAGDIDGLMTVFRDAIQVTAANDYDQQQRDAWSQAHDHNSLADLLAEGEVMVAEWEEKPVGFAQRQDDHINMVFVHPQASGLGIATLLCQHLEDSARVAGVASLTTHASLTAHDFFTYMGFVSEHREEVQRAGIALPRHFMRKSLQ